MIFITEAHAQAVDTAAALAKLGDQGLLGVFCVLLIAGIAAVTMDARSARAELRQIDKDRLADPKELTELTVKLSLNMAAVATALEASNKSTIEGNVFRQQLTTAMETLADGTEAQVKNLGEQSVAMRAAMEALCTEFGRLNEAARELMQRGAR